MVAKSPSGHSGDRLRRSLSLNGATLLVVSSVIGSGIFFTPGQIAQLLPHAGLIFVVWIAGGLLSLAGALANAELGSMFPRAGGDYVYLREAYSPAAGFLVGWLTFFVIYIGTIATLAVAFSTGLSFFVDYGAGGQLGVAVAIVVGISALNYVGLRWGTLANNLTAYLKIGALLAFTLAAPLLGHGEMTRLELFSTPLSSTGADLSILAFGAALPPVLFSYLGWNAAIYVASEIRDPGRNIPRSLFLGLGLCTLVYLLVNAVYLFALPLETLGGAENVGVLAARSLFGRTGGDLVGILVLGSILGTLNAMILIGPRIAYAMAIDGLFFRRVETVHPRFNTPHIAIVVQAIGVVVLLFVINGFPDSLFLSALRYATFAIVLATMADISALYVLRWRRPERHRPYRAWGYPWLPAVYFLANGGIALAMLLKNPDECLIGLLVAATGLPFYVWFVRSSR
uniref:Basic amino acid/polyamine antiporter, APA family n=1 Tax=Candidatus Kentrum sp. FM TaxID=2126340 RepID=A0A450TRK5_9GAMM|nr:MAG: basic amino acid/polyamine antiporter, APA family [Candidatus Kentron sp. FM]VFJ70954.1 MAG: basic amino acid/polyamine antiporter, APA family [Candidatus Kentron sp. FM]VFK18574.1 MAG: basic amino acid/polyamine antiporter, APA family [Candidatus Kentron sp. FM]